MGSGVGGLVLMIVAALVIALILPAASAPVPAGADSVFAGERCLLCGRELVPGEHAFRYRGRRVTVCDHCLPAWQGDPDAVFAALQPRGALFQEPAGSAPPVGRGWFALGVYILVGVLCGAAAACFAVNRGHRPLPWFLAGLFANVVALAALPVVLSRGGPADAAGVPGGLRKVPKTRAPVVCERCGHQNHPAASACSRCAAVLRPRAESDVDRLREER